MSAKQQNLSPSGFYSSNLELLSDFMLPSARGRRRRMTKCTMFPTSRVKYRAQSVLPIAWRGWIRPPGIAEREMDFFAFCAKKLISYLYNIHVLLFRRQHEAKNLRRVKRDRGSRGFVCYQRKCIAAKSSRRIFKCQRTQFFHSWPGIPILAIHEETTLVHKRNCDNFCQKPKLAR